MPRRSGADKGAPARLSAETNSFQYHRWVEDGLLSLLLELCLERGLLLPLMWCRKRIPLFSRKGERGSFHHRRGHRSTHTRFDTVPDFASGIYAAVLRHLDRLDAHVCLFGLQARHRSGLVSLKQPTTDIVLTDWAHLRRQPKPRIGDGRMSSHKRRDESLAWMTAIPQPVAIQERLWSG